MLTRKNFEIREAAARAGVYLWQVAQELGCTDSTLSKRLRNNLSEDEKRRFFAAIERVKEQREE